jgi:hypothetical protein
LIGITDIEFINAEPVDVTQISAKQPFRLLSRRHGASPRKVTATFYYAVRRNARDADWQLGVDAGQ